MFAQTYLKKNYRYLFVAFLQYMFYGLKDTFYSRKKEPAMQLLIDSSSSNTYDVGDIMVKYHYSGKNTQDDISYYKLTQKDELFATATKIDIVPLTPSSSFGIVGELLPNSTCKWVHTSHRWIIKKNIRNGDLLAIKEF